MKSSSICDNFTKLKKNRCTLYLSGLALGCLPVPDKTFTNIYCDNKPTHPDSDGR